MSEVPTFPIEGRRRVAIENVTPQIDAGRHAIKRTIGETVTVEADLFADGHDLLAAVVKYRTAQAPQWSESPMESLGNDRWRGNFTITEPGSYWYNIETWIDRFKSWRDDARKKVQAGQDVTNDLREGVALVESAAQRASQTDSGQLRQWAGTLGEPSGKERIMDSALLDLMSRNSDRRFAATLDEDLQVVVDPERGRFSAWYEMFPRSFAAEPGRHGTFKDCEAQLPRIAAMGYDVLYIPPIHPIGRSFRKGKNNNPKSEPGEPGSPWAIGASEGGHKSIHPELGTVEDFRRFVENARAQGLEVAMDIALQCSPDHPYVREHPEWFRKRADGSIHYAENPPKKYEDIYPFDFECDDWRRLWAELKSIFEFWIQQGVRIFRVDNPHTKAFSFWEWCLGELKRECSDLVFLAEAFTRPAVMRHLAKIGFTQSYSYFPWRNSKYELTEYLTEMTRSPLAEYFRPALWPNTPDILAQFLQTDVWAAFAIRFVLAATLGPSYGIYGPAFEVCENTPLNAGGEEYLNAEKFEIRRWNLDAGKNMSDLMSRVNRIRRENRALQSNHRLQFLSVDNDRLLAFTKMDDEGGDVILTVVNLDPFHVHSGWLDLPVNELLSDPRRTYQMHDLLTDRRFLWQGTRNYVELNPSNLPAHIFRLRQHVRTERDFDYFM